MRKITTILLNAFQKNPTQTTVFALCFIAVPFMFMVILTELRGKVLIEKTRADKCENESKTKDSLFIEYVKEVGRAEGYREAKKEISK